MAPTDATTAARMANVRTRGTTPERRVRSALTRLGVRYRVRNPDLPGRPDIANRRRRWVVFVHGCFWHRHTRCAKASWPKRNAEFWREKLTRNTERDREVLTRLRALGFRVAVVWECETLDASALEARLAAFLADK
jgi:DNA mismatch endonuclease (patch repair protein)